MVTSIGTMNARIIDRLHSDLIILVANKLETEIELLAQGAADDYPDYRARVATIKTLQWVIDGADGMYDKMTGNER